MSKLMKAQEAAKNHQTAEAMKTFKGLLTYPPDDEYVEVQVLGSEEVMHLPAKEPTTVATMTPYQAAKKIRTFARVLSKPLALHLPSMKLLEEAINKRTSKSERLTILERLKAEQKQLFDTNRSYIEQIQQLVQHLPTAENLPSSKAENVLRAIQAVLKNYEKNGKGEEVDF